MLKKGSFCCFVITLLAFTQTAFGVLSPFNQSLVEIKRIIESPELGKAFSNGEAIIEIRRIDRGYIVRSKSKEVFVEVVYNPSTRPGPVQFDLRFHNE